MDGLFSLIWVVFIVVTLTNALSGKNKKRKTSSTPPREQPISYQDLLDQHRGKQGSAAKPAEQAKLPTFNEVQKWFLEPQAAPAKAEQTSMPLGSMSSPKPAPAMTVAAPKVHTHLSLDCDIDEPSGSMDYVSTEGMDPCHDDELPGRSNPRPGIPVMREQPGLALEWTSDALVRSVIMQEVLTRPSQRQRR